MCDHKEYARQMRTNAVVRNDIVQVTQELWEQIATIIENSVEVVRCKDCKHWKFIDSLNPHWECQIFYGLHDYGYLTGADDFCSYGERREGE